MSVRAFVFGIVPASVMRERITRERKLPSAARKWTGRSNVNAKRNGSQKLTWLAMTRYGGRTVRNDGCATTRTRYSQNNHRPSVGRSAKYKTIIGPLRIPVL